MVSEHEVLLTDAESGKWLEEYHLSSTDGVQLAGSTDWSIHKRTLRGGLSDGVDVVTVDNGALSFDVLPTRGMGLWRGEYQGIDLGWRSPVKHPVHPAFVNLTERQGLGWLAGFNEWMCRCGLSSFGAPGNDIVEKEDALPVETPLTLHGRIANTPAHRVSAWVDGKERGTLAVQGEMEEASLFGPKLRLISTVQTVAGSNSIEIVDEITNLSDESGELQILYHTNMGPPLLEQGARIVAGFKRIAPCNEHAAASIESWDICAAPTTGFLEQCYFIEPIANGNGDAHVMLCNAAADKGFSLSFNVQELPCLTVWKNTAGNNDGYVTGLEPGTSYPNLKSFERQHGRVLLLSPGETYRTSLKITIHGDADSVADKAEEIHQQMAGCSPTLHREMHPDFSPLVG